MTCPPALPARGSSWGRRRAAVALGAAVVALGALSGTANAAPPDQPGQPAATSWPKFSALPQNAGDKVQIEYAPNGTVIGFTFLQTNSDRRTRKLQVCDLVNDGKSVSAQVDPSGSAGAITYPDPWGGGCYIRNLGYGIAGFRLVVGTVFRSPWFAPPPL